MAFKGWLATALEFYEGLEADNSKAYWSDNRSVYERDVKAPMVALLSELRAEFGDGRVFRPNRDTRFSADKDPYKTSIAATVGDGYIQLSADGLMAGAGMFHLASDQLERYRMAVADDRRGGALEGIVGSLVQARIDIHGTDPLKTAPRGYAKDHPRVTLLRNRGLVAMQMWPVAGWLGTSTAKVRIVELLRAAKPLSDWLNENVGASTLEEVRPGRR